MKMYKIEAVDAGEGLVGWEVKAVMQQRWNYGDSISNSASSQLSMLSVRSNS